MVICFRPSTDYQVISTATVKGNQVQNCTGIGIVVNGNYAKISENNVSSCVSRGISVVGDDGTIHGNTVRNNTFYGIVINGNYNTVMGNSCIDDQGVKTQNYGIAEIAGSDYNIYIGNQIHGWETAATLLVGANDLPVPASFATMNITTA